MLSGRVRPRQVGAFASVGVACEGRAMPCVGGVFASAGKGTLASVGVSECALTWLPPAAVSPTL